jgi:hypothetical protein
VRKSGNSPDRGFASNGIIRTGLKGGPDILCVELSPPDKLKQSIIRFEIFKGEFFTYRVNVELKN